MTDAFEVDSNSLALIEGGAERLDALIALIDGARENLRLLYYIFAEDEAGRRVNQALLAAAARGVTVALIVDGFGSDAASQDDFFAPLRDAGIEVCAFLPRLGRRYLLRNHQKMAIADGARAIIGGFNIADGYFADGEETAWRDLGLWLEGPAVTQLSGYFDTLQAWTRQPRARMRDLRRALREWSDPSGRVRWLLGGPVRGLSPWAAAVRTDLTSAKRADLIAAYFAPNPAMLRRLYRLGNRVRVITAAKTDNVATISAARFTYPGLLRRNVQVFEYQPTQLHTKLVLIDDLVYIGSANFDMRSLYLNLEVMLRINDAAFAAHVRGYIDREVAASACQKLSDYIGWRTWIPRVRRTISYFLVAIVDYNVSRRLNFPEP